MSKSFRSWGLPLMLALSVALLAACEPLPEEGAPQLNLPRQLPLRASAAPSPSVAPSPTPTRGRLLQPTSAAEEGTPTPDPAALAWAQRVGLAGTPTVESSERLNMLARAEADVLVYADTSRCLTALEGLIAAEPGLSPEVYAQSSLDTYLQFVSDSAQGVHAADVYLVGDAPRTLQLLEQQRLWNYVPSELEAVLDEADRSPLLTHHWTALTLMYNPSLAMEPPVDNWWDLTRPEWRGRVVLADPLDDDRLLYWLTTLTQHADELAEAYRAEFGQELVLDDDVYNAAYQWIKDLIANEPVLLPGDAEVAAFVGGLDVSELRIGLCGSEQLPKVQRDELHLAMLSQVAPAAGLRWRTYLAIADRSPHPNAARVVVRWLMGDAGGGGGYAPWYEPGFYPARNDVPDPPGAVARAELAPRLWELDAAYVASHQAAVQDFISMQLEQTGAS